MPSLLSRFRKNKGAQASSAQEAAAPNAVGSATSSVNPSSSTTVGDAPRTSRASQGPGGTPPQSHDEGTPSIAPFLPSVPHVKTAVEVVPPAADPAESAAPILPERLWDRAYEALKADEPVLLRTYENHLSRELDKNVLGPAALECQRGATEQAIPGSAAPERQRSVIEQTNPTVRRSQMTQLVKLGLMKTQREAKVKDIVGNALHVVLSAKEIVDSALQAVPQAALAWTGVCFALQIFLNPTEESKANREGIVYIISMMDWYWNLSSLLLKENIREVDGRSYAGLQRELENRIVDLYKKLLSYQIKSVCSYYRMRGITVSRDIVKLDDWNGSLKTVKESETAVREYSKVYNTIQISDNLDQLVNIAERKLHDIYSALQQQAEREECREDNQCLQDLRLTNPTDDMIRIEGTKGGLLLDSYVWILGHRDFLEWRDGDETRLLWIRGDPGKGKTMLLIGIIKELKKSIHDSGLSYFFCEGRDSRLNHVTAVLRGLIYQLIIQERALISYLREEYDKAGKQMFEDVNAFVALSKILTKMLNDPRLTKVYLVVDALDECNSVRPLLDFIVQNASTPSSQVKWLVSSRNERDIEDRLKIKGSNMQLSLELNAESVSGAVAAYIRYKVSKLDEEKQYKELQAQITGVLQKKADGTFLWVALVCNELESVANRNVLKVLDKMPSKLKDLYIRMMDQIEKLEWDGEECKNILATVTLAYRPLHLDELATLTGIANDGSLIEIIKECASFLVVRERIVHLVHQSAKDYLTNDRESQKILPAGRAKGHAVIVSRSLRAMSETMRRDIFHLLDSGCSIQEVELVSPDPLGRIRYACFYWIEHLCEIDAGLHDKVGLRNDGEIHGFLREHFLHWLEALSLMKCIPRGVAMIRKLANLLATHIDGSRLLDLVQDELRFILHNAWVIENAPLQTYVSALIFSPVRSLTRQHWKKEEPEWIITKPMVESDWSLCLQTLEGHGGPVTSVVFSHDSRQLASASADRTVKVWDADTGKCVQTLEGHRHPVTSVVFSHDSRQLASASHDHTVKVWDAETGKCVQTLSASSLSELAFDSSRSHLITNFGIFALGHSSFLLDIGSEAGDAITTAAPSPPDVKSPQEPHWCGYALSSDRSWITWHGRNVLWLPPGYRPGKFAISGATVGIGCERRVLLIRFSPDVSPS